MSSSKKLYAVGGRHMEEALAEQDRKASSTMKLAMDTLDLGLEAARITHRTAKRLRASVASMTLAGPRLASSKK